MSKILDLEFLYYFSSASIHVLEAKIKGLDEGAPPDRVFHWLCYDRTTQQFQKLDFKSMSSEDNRSYRKFVQGELWFDASAARLEWQTGTITKEVTLQVNQPNTLPDQLNSQVHDFLHGLFGNAL